MRATMVLNPVISKLSGKLVVLASASPRRLEILRNAGLQFEVVPSWFKETLDKGLFKAPHEYAVETAKQKALEVARRMPSKHLKTPDMVIGADTIVAVDGMILEKPGDKYEAYKMLSSLSGKEHSVFTGVALVLCNDKESEPVDYQTIDFYEETKVKFSDLSESMLWEYINSGEPMDKAGGYGIQALGGMLVEYVHGDFLNVVGFPLNHFCKQLDRIYNHRASTSGRESPSFHLSLNGTHSTSVLTQSSSKIAASSSSSSSPGQKVKRKGSECGEGGSSWKSVNSVSAHANDKEVALSECGSAALHQTTSTGQVMEQSVTKPDDREPRKEHLQRLAVLMDGFKASKALFTACELRVFDLLQRRPGLDVAQVAQELQVSVKGAERLLEACVPLGLLKCKDTTCQRRGYENTELAAQFLWSESPWSLHGHIQHCNSTVWPLFTHLEAAVRDGTNQHQRVTGNKPNSPFQDTYYNSQEVKLRFMKAMHSVARITGASVAKAFDLSGFRTACDIGGCTGAMAYELAEAQPGLAVTVFDLPAVVEMRERFHPRDQTDKVSFIAGDFFKDDLPKADLYILARILHDWPDEKVHSLLSKIAAVCPPGSGLLLCEIFLDEDRGGPSRGLLQALSMSDGKQRSATEYSELLKSHGFVTAHVRHTGDLLDAMLCIKV